MRSFFKYTLATIFGLFLFLFIGLIILIGIGASAGKGNEVSVKDNSVLKIKLDGPIVEREVENPFENLDFPGAPESNIGLYEL